VKTWIDPTLDGSTNFITGATAAITDTDDESTTSMDTLFVNTSSPFSSAPDSITWDRLQIGTTPADVSVIITPVPEPASLGLLMGAATLGCGVWYRRSRMKSNQA
jgi:hypothetical protein